MWPVMGQAEDGPEYNAHRTEQQSVADEDRHHPRFDAERLHDADVAVLLGDDHREDGEDAEARDADDHEEQDVENAALDLDGREKRPCRSSQLSTRTSG